jgi:hypothetical protein
MQIFPIPAEPRRTVSTFRRFYGRRAAVGREVLEQNATIRSLRAFLLQTDPAIGTASVA